jgi:hypothetical protein
MSIAYSPNIFIVLFHFGDRNYLIIKECSVWAFIKCNRLVLIVIAEMEESWNNDLFFILYVASYSPKKFPPGGDHCLPGDPSLPLLGSLFYYSSSPMKKLPPVATIRCDWSFSRLFQPIRTLLY